MYLSIFDQPINELFLKDVPRAWSNGFALRFNSDEIFYDRRRKM
jgi:hypothetical protein